MAAQEAAQLPQPPPTASLTAPSAPSVTLPGRVSVQALRPARPAEFFTMPAAQPTSPAVEAGPGGDISLNFVNTEIRDVVRAVLGDTLRLNVAIDPRIQGQITLQTNRPLRRDAVIPLLEEVLRIHGVGLMRTGEAITAAPLPEVTRRGAVMDRPGQPQGGLIVRALQLDHIAPTEVIQAAQALLPQDVVLRPVPGRAALLVSGTQRDVDAAAELVATLDVDALAGASLAVFYPRSVDARVLVRELESIYGAQPRRGAGAPLRFIPLSRLNAVLAVARRGQILREVAQWVDRLDQAAEATEVRLFIYNVQHGRASDLAGVLSRLFDVGGAQPGVRRSMIAGAGAEFAPEPALPGGPPGMAPSPLPPVGEPRAPASIPQPGIRPSPTPDPGLEGEFPAEPSLAPVGDPARGMADMVPRIIADETNNALLIRATPRDYRLIESAIARLDSPPMQVLIEAVVAEVTLTNDLRYGVQWFLQQGDFRGVLSEAATGLVDSRFPGFSLLLGGSDLRAVLNALEAVTRVNVVSSPKLLVTNNQTASLQVGDQVPVATQSAVSILNPGAPIVNTIQFRDTGVILRVTPRANETGFVRLDISQEISDVVRTTSSGIDSPTIQQRKFASSVSVASGETIALAGLIRDRRTDGNSGIPILQDIPIIGNLFGVKTDVGARTDLIVLLTPRIVRSPADLREVTNELREVLRGSSGATRRR
ncbi:type II secretion system secretin GspD [Elioraea tepidiphila]|jgi:general secretion pathway protein D|uniref:type II secretion system secretin GspD n=1 Tax=Elioraea tepidiphila TaxID=457934 RepID=UPI00138AB699|nr:type II secretion system secretin GspD [Elioraea tepidiphila]